MYQALGFPFGSAVTTMNSPMLSFSMIKARQSSLVFPGLLSSAQMVIIRVVRTIVHVVIFPYFLICVVLLNFHTIHDGIRGYAMVPTCSLLDERIRISIHIHTRVRRGCRTVCGRISSHVVPPNLPLVIKFRTSVLGMKVGFYTF